MTNGERRLAERLEQKLDDDYLLWYDVPVGPKQSHPDFVAMHPRRGLQILMTNGRDTLRKLAASCVVSKSASVTLEFDPNEQSASAT